MNKKLIRLTESDLHNIVKESVGKILKETSDNFYLIIHPKYIWYTTVIIFISVNFPSPL